MIRKLQPSIRPVHYLIEPVKSINLSEFCRKYDYYRIF